VGVNRFEDLRVWQAARQQGDRVGTLLQHSAFRRDLALFDQMNRAALSVLFDISEGFVRGLLCCRGASVSHGRRDAAID
jgi:hypothetical protein